jgi:hypothetical protein
VTAAIDIAELVRRGPAMMVATRDSGLRPELARAWGPSLSADGSRLTMCVEAAPGSAMTRNLAARCPLAASLSHLTSHLAVQLKGAVVDVAPPTSERLGVVSDHVDRFVADTARVGVPEAIARGLVGPDLVTVTMAITERIDETPGA